MKLDCILTRTAEPSLLNIFTVLEIYSNKIGIIPPNLRREGQFFKSFPYDNI